MEGAPSDARQAEDFQQTRLTGGPGGASNDPMKTLQRLGEGEMCEHGLPLHLICHPLHAEPQTNPSAQPATSAPVSKKLLVPQSSPKGWQNKSQMTSR